jgi:hypothetical protein
LVERDAGAHVAHAERDHGQSRDGSERVTHAGFSPRLTRN